MASRVDTQNWNWLRPPTGWPSSKRSDKESGFVVDYKQWNAVCGDWKINKKCSVRGVARVQCTGGTGKVDQRPSIGIGAF